MSAISYTNVVGIIVLFQPEDGVTDTNPRGMYASALCPRPELPALADACRRMVALIDPGPFGGVGVANMGWPDRATTRSPRRSSA